MPNKNTAAERWTIHLDFVGANQVVPVGQGESPAVVSYFKGPRSQWQTGLRIYTGLLYQDLWPGIDLLYSGTVNRLKYTFFVHPGADPKLIQLAYRGANEVRLLQTGKLEVITPAGSFQDDIPAAYQNIAGQNAVVTTCYVLQRDGDGWTYGFQIDTYDQTRPLVIDPSVLVYAGFIGGSGDDAARGIAVDKDGNAYVVGYTTSTEESLPVSAGPDTTANGGTDAFIAKVNATGTGLVYLGYIGGAANDFGQAIALDGAGNATITGYTASSQSSFPIVGGPGLVFSGGYDAFVTSINAGGTDLRYSGYIGGTGDDKGYGVAVDPSGSAYITGRTTSGAESFPAVIGPDLIYHGGQDGFIAQVRPDGTGLAYAGYLGGSGEDGGTAIAVDETGSAYVTGYTYSPDNFPVVVGPDLSYNWPPGPFGTPPNAFVAKIAPGGDALVYAGFVGDWNTKGSGIAVDTNHLAYVAGTGFRSFISRVKADGSGFDYQNQFITDFYDDTPALTVDEFGVVYIAGKVKSSDVLLPSTGGRGPLGEVAHGGYDAIFAVLDPAGTQFLTTGYIGSSGDDGGLGIAVDQGGNAYITGFTGSNTFPAITGPDLVYHGSNDAFVIRISPLVNVLLSGELSPSLGTAGNFLTYTIAIVNDMPYAAPNLVLTGTFPASMIVQHLDATQGSCSPLAGVGMGCDLGALAGYGTITATVVVIPSRGGIFTPTMDVSWKSPGDPPIVTSTGFRSVVLQNRAFTVTRTSDSIDAAPGDNLCADASGDCTLRAAIMEANSVPGADTITLPAGIYTLAIPGTGENAAATGDLDITDDLTLTGAGADSTFIDGSGLDRVVDIFAPAQVAFTGVTIRHGKLQTYINNGGGILNNGVLTLNQMALRENEGYEGGGIYNAGVMTATNITVAGNLADYSGGGINNNWLGTATVLDSTFAINKGFFAGGIHNRHYFSLTNATLSGNSGGNIYNETGGTMTILNVSIVGQAGAKGGYNSGIDGNYWTNIFPKYPGGSWSTMAQLLRQYSFSRPQSFQR
ncbi:MAG: SBBP repeat-containing protein [Chloroflexi bacterium]|nr:SBBP repeat-containing protein [Chloroflexota bacterium]